MFLYPQFTQYVSFNTNIYFFAHTLFLLHHPILLCQSTIDAVIWFFYRLKIAVDIGVGVGGGEGGEELMNNLLVLMHFYSKCLSLTKVFVVLLFLFIQTKQIQNLG